MYASELEARLQANRYPKGGVAPLRHELASHNHIERQREWASRSHPVSFRAGYTRLGTLAATIAHSAALIAATFSFHRRAPR